MASFEGSATGRSPEEALLVALLGMGFDESAAQRAIRAPGVTNAESAINFILSMPEDGGEDEDEDEDEDVDEDVEPMKMIICIRTDLKMTPGKVAAQSVHAALGAYRLSEAHLLKQWEAQGESTVCLAVESDEQLETVLMSAIQHGLVVSAQYDAGRTEVEPNTRTCGAIGPALNKSIDPVTRSLRLYK